MDTNQLKKRKISDAEYAEGKAEISRIRIDGIVYSILNQTYIGKFANVNVTRNEHQISIDWEFRPGAEDAANYKVTGLIREIELIPSKSYGMWMVIWKGRGEDTVSLTLQEGRSYFFEWHFLDTEMPERPDGEFNTEAHDMITFDVPIPLSDEKRAILEKVLKEESSPEEMIRKQIQGYLDKQDTFDSELKNGIERIKRKNLPQDEEEDQIARLKERINQWKERLGT